MKFGRLGGFNTFSIYDILNLRNKQSANQRYRIGIEFKDSRDSFL